MTGAPNVVVIVFDDLGFAHLGCYGSDLLTPNLDRLGGAWVAVHELPHDGGVLADACVPADRPQPSPGRHGHAARPADELPGVLGSHAALGGDARADPARPRATRRSASASGTSCRAIERVTGPYDMWPTGLGFDRYYGFLNGETNQWTPNLVRDTNHVEPPTEPDDGYHLDADLADNAIAYLRELRISHPDRPFLLWYASAAPHAPHQAPPEWIDRFRGRFDDGWDAWRAATLARQIELGILPAGTRLLGTPAVDRGVVRRSTRPAAVCTRG